MQTISGDRSSAGQDEDDHDDEGESAESNEDFEGGEGVEDMLRVLEEGGALPDIEGLMEAENPQVLFIVLPCLALSLPMSCPVYARSYTSPALPCPRRGNVGCVLMQCRIHCMDILITSIF